ncbi:anthranilate synthase component I [Alkalibacillus aidingensis]|uniref:anthranilate synthase component I n=1 Tax=Alkalibacillus aidingensis TaxID=2747607 RepID=UPI001CB751DE|nr:anthranilate synthase component I [Alkalibacillus aidingensis]
MIHYRYETIEGDHHTPISIFLQLQGENKFLLESSLKHEDSGRYSLVGVDPYYELIAYNDDILLNDLVQQTSIRKKQNPIDALKPLMNEELDLPFEIPFPSGGVGYIAYDVAKQFEVIGQDHPDELNMPDVHMMFYEKVIVYDHLLQQVHCIVFDRWITGESGDHELELRKLVNQIETGTFTETTTFKLKQFQSNLTQSDYEQMVIKAKQHIQEGDIFQAVLSQRLTADYEGDPFVYYRKLRKSNPSPYMFYIGFKDYTILGTSPESLVKVQDRQVTTNPIAGTRKRGACASEDQRLAEELLADEKEIAEHQMLVDLGRNDIGRVAEPGSISLSKYMVIERYRYVMHIVSEVTGELDHDTPSLEALKACLPAGTVSGAPKIRAMQIINELEPSKRGAYSGAVGYLSINGNLDFALAIRTMILKDAKAHVQAGAGVVYDSDPMSEYEETLNKAKALMEVI